MYRAKLRFFSLSSLFRKLRPNSSSSSYSSCASSLLPAAPTTAYVTERINLLYPPWVKSLIESLDGDIAGRQVSESGNLYPCVKSAMASLDGDIARRRLKFSECVKSYGFSHSLESFAMLVGIFSSANMYGEVRFLFHSMAADFCKSYNYWKLLPLVLLHEILHLSNGSITPSQAYGFLILVLEESSMSGHARLVVSDAEKMGIQVRVPLSNLFLRRLVVGSEVGAARNLFFRPSPNVYTFTVMMDDYNNTKLEVDTLFYEAGEILMEMEESGGVSPAPDIGLAYGAYLLELCVAGRLERAWELLCDLQERGQPCNYNNCYNALMLGFCHRGGDMDMDKSLMVFKMMKDCPGLSPDLNSYTILIDGFCNKGHVEKAYKLLYEMDVGYGIMPTAAIYRSLVPSSFLLGDAEESTLKAFLKLKSEGYGDDDPFIYFILHSLYHQYGDVDATSRLWEEMIDNGFNMDVMMHMLEFISQDD